MLKNWFKKYHQITFFMEGRLISLTTSRDPIEVYIMILERDIQAVIMSMCRITKREHEMLRDFNEKRGVSEGLPKDLK